MKEKRQACPWKQLIVAMLCGVMLLGLGTHAFATVTQDRTTEDINISFRFSKDEYIIDTYMEHGEITPHGTIRVPAGTNQSFAFTPHTGYRIERVIVDGTVVWNRTGSTTVAPTGYAFRRVLQDHTLEVVFVEIPKPTATPTATPRASATPTFTIATPTPTAGSGGSGGGGGGGGGGSRPTTQPTTGIGSTTPPLSGGGGGSGAPDREYTISDEDIPQTGIGSSSVGDCFE